MDNIVEEIQNKLTEAGVNIPDEVINERIELLRGFDVNNAEISRAVIKHFGTEAGLDMKSLFSGGDNPEVKVNTIKKPDTWASVRVKVLQLWDANHESIHQVGLVGDETGTIKFTSWVSAGAMEMEVDGCYLIKNVVASVFNGRMQIGLNKKSVVEPIIDNIEVGFEETQIYGALVNIQAGSGLIKRCPECKRALRQGVCSVHGKVDGVYDLRIKGSVDDGFKTNSILLNTELTEQVTGITLEQAKALATEALDQSVVLDQFRRSLMSKFYIVKGSEMDSFILVDDVQPMGDIPESDIDALVKLLPREVA